MLAHERLQVYDRALEFATDKVGPIKWAMKCAFSLRPQPSRVILFALANPPDIREFQTALPLTEGVNEIWTWATF